MSRHDKWLCMMYPRLQLLRKLLAPTGCLIISISMHEMENLVELCRELFPTFNVQVVTVQTSGGKPSNGFNVSHEYLIFVCPDGFVPNPLDFSGGNARSPFEGLTLSTFDKTTRPNQAYPVFIDRKTLHIVNVGKSLQALIDEGSYSGPLEDFPFTDLSTDELACVWPITSKGKQCVWRLIPERLTSDWNKGYIKVSPNTAKDCPNEFSIQYLPSGVIAKITSGSLKVVGTEPDSPTLQFGENATEGGQIPTIWLEKAFRTTNGTQELAAIFPEVQKAFDYPKPVKLVENVLQAAANRNALILDSFAGSGTTGHAVMNLNARDGGSRRFILIELSDYADSLTAERQRRVIHGYTAAKNSKIRIYHKKLTSNNLKNVSNIYDEAIAVAESHSKEYSKIIGPKLEDCSVVVDGVVERGKTIPGIDSGFSYFNLGPTLFSSERQDVSINLAPSPVSLNASVPVEEVQRYVWFMETRQPYIDRRSECPWLLGEYLQAAYYLVYEPGKEYVLDYDLLGKLPLKGSPTVIYANRSAISTRRLEAMNIVFKQLPSQIARM